MYTILYYPERELNEFINVAIEVTKKRYGERIMHSKLIVNMFRLLQTIPDYEPKLFALLFMIGWEENIAESIKETFDGNGMFGKNDVQHFSSYLIRINMFIDKTVKFHYNKHNIIEIVNSFVQSAKLEYVMGPL